MRPSVLSSTRLVVLLFLVTLLVSVLYNRAARTGDLPTDPLPAGAAQGPMGPMPPVADPPGMATDGAPAHHLVENGAPESHEVSRGETLYGIARRYGLSVAELQAANGLVGERIQVGQVLKLAPGDGDDVSLGALFQWPLVAPVSSPFGPRWGKHHAGVDLAANQGAPIKAARDGKVILAESVQGYGNTVILEHEDGVRTLYGHCEKLQVKAGQRVKQGDTIATVGSTGNSTGPHLHFEIRRDNKAVNPMDYLPNPS